MKKSLSPYSALSRQSITLLAKSCMKRATQETLVSQANENPIPGLCSLPRVSNDIARCRCVPSSITRAAVAHSPKVEDEYNA